MRSSLLLLVSFVMAIHFEPSGDATFSLAIASKLEDSLQELDTRVLTDDRRQELSQMVSRDIERRRLAAIQRENNAWHQVKNRADWEQFRDPRLQSLRESLGEFPAPPAKPKFRVTGELQGDGYRIQNLVIESRAGLFVTANLYLPADPRKSMPAILLSHSHHNSKTQGELQDMGMTWARQGWLVLVMDHLGHGERRQHPFVRGEDYPQSFRLGRQDYYFRYNVGVQLQLLNESLMGWMAYDLTRGVDFLTAREDVDQEKIILVGAVAGGGDPAGVAAALDPRIAAVAPFNFGGPQPDYAIPQDAENEFYYFGVAYWETTRCLRLGGRDGFAHWTIVASLAPRRLIYSHEFGWDRQRDPVWPRLEKVFRLYDARDHLDVATGRGSLKGQPPENTHCNNVGVYHRRKFYPHWQRWFQMQPPAHEFQDRRQIEELTCLTPEVSQQLAPQPVHQLVGRLADQRLAATREHLQSLGTQARRQKLRQDWSQLLGDVSPANAPRVQDARTETRGEVSLERISLEVETGIVVPLLLLRAASNQRKDAPIVVVAARCGKQRFVQQRAKPLAELLEGGAVVCLPDLRGLGETGSGGSLEPRGNATSLSCRDQVLGQTLLGSRLRDLRSVLRYLRGRQDLSGWLALWGDSTAAVNPPSRRGAAPHGVDNPNVTAEPTGGLLVLLAALFEDDVEAVYARGTLTSFRSLLDSQFFYVPHDAIVPGVLQVGDLAGLATAAAPRPLRLDDLVDGRNRLANRKMVQSDWEPALHAYREQQASPKLSLGSADSSPAAWLLRIAQEKTPAAPSTPRGRE